MTILKSLRKQKINTTIVDEDGTIIPKVVYWIEANKEFDDRIIKNESNTPEYEIVPLRPGYQNRNRVLNAWTQEI